jgi:hypothetical protein
MRYVFRAGRCGTPHDVNVSGHMNCGPHPAPACGRTKSSWIMKHVFWMLQGTEKVILIQEQLWKNPIIVDNVTHVLGVAGDGEGDFNPGAAVEEPNHCGLR